MRLKVLFLFTIVFFTIPVNRVFAVDHLDSGFNLLRLDSKIEDVQQFLIETSKESLWNKSNADEIGKSISSGWLFDFAKAGFTSYLGQNIERVEIYFTESQAVQRVYNFKIYIAKPKKEAHEEFVTAAYALYGELSEIEDSELRIVIGLVWQTEKTDFTISYGYDFDDGAKFDFYIIDFQKINT